MNVKLLILIIGFTFCFSFKGHEQSTLKIVTDKEVKCGAERVPDYLPLLKGKSIGVVANQTSMIGGIHLVDSLLALGLDVKKVFAPEHGFRGTADAGEHVSHSTDIKTGLPLISLYGRNKKPNAAQLENIDVMIFDIQDVGVRYYTYISTLHYVMEACGEQNVEVMILDRPNPNGHFIDGPILEPKYKSFVGMHEVPLVHGMTVGEYGRMINGEGWLENDVQCELKVISCEGYDHEKLYQLPIKPSPNLPNMSSIYLYPSLGLFEGTVVSVGRGTDSPFQMIGMPNSDLGDFEFTPEPKPGAKYPKHKGEKCSGYNLSDFGSGEMKFYGGLYLHWLVKLYESTPNKEDFFLDNGFFNLLAGNATLKKQIEEGKTPKEIRASWEDGLKTFSAVRSKYLIYPESN
ncbi:MAG: DUF1343 domain-containing protein [Flavobacteriales bacterium]|nr:DUF1343 domain-containing protein [Flavobacteriales bacterium]